MLGFILLGYTLCPLAFDLGAYTIGIDVDVIVPLFWAIPMLALNVLNLYIMETPRFYLNRNNDKVIELLNAIAKRNNKPKK